LSEVTSAFLLEVLKHWLIPVIVVLVVKLITQKHINNREKTMKPKQKAAIGWAVGILAGIALAITFFLIGKSSTNGTNQRTNDMAAGTPQKQTAEVAAAKTQSSSAPPSPIQENQCVFPPAAKIHIFNGADGSAKAGLPAGSKVYITTNQTPSDITAEIDLHGAHNIKQLTVDIEYEYHSDSHVYPASLGFAIKDSQGVRLWSAKHQFVPKVCKTRVHEPTIVFPVDSKCDLPSVTVEVTPLNAGDFGFYIYKLDGMLTTQ